MLGYNMFAYTLRLTCFDSASILKCLAFTMQAIRAVENDYRYRQCLAQVLCCFCFASASGTCWSASIEQVHAIRQSHIALISQWRHHQTYGQGETKAIHLRLTLNSNLTILICMNEARTQ